MTSGQARAAYRASSARAAGSSDYFCLTPVGVRAGYLSPALLGTLSGVARRALAGRVVWATTANPIYASDGIRPGATQAAAIARFRHVFRLGPWYLSADGGVLKIGHGVVEEVGVANRALIADPAARRLLGLV
jgi:hypothetical protein